MSHDTLDTLLRAAHAAGASDLHLIPHQRPHMRQGNRLEPLGESALSPTELEAMARAHFGAAHIEYQASAGSVQRPFRLEGGVVGRTTLSTTRGDYSLAARFWRGPTELGLAEVRAPEIVADWLGSPHGLIVVAGPHGSGKTTTLYAMTEWLNTERTLHICTVEDPVGYELVSKRSLVQQREVGIDVPTVAAGVTAALGQDLDALTVGTLTDLDALSAVLHAAETGHLVLVQVHANSAEEAIERLVEASPPSMHPMVRRSLAETLRGVLCQRLVKRPKDGRLAVYEALAPDDRLRAVLTSGGSLRGLPRGEGSLSLAAELDRLEAAGAVSAEGAAQARATLGE